MLQTALFLINKFNRIRHNKSKFTYFELSEINQNLIANQWNDVIHQDIVDNIEYFKNNNIHVYDEFDMEFSIPHIESLYSCIMEDIRYYNKHPNEAWICSHIEENLTAFVTMASISDKFHSDDRFKRLYSMLSYRM